MKNGNATSPAERRAYIERVLAAWEALPELRLGQLVCNGAGPDAADPFYTRDGCLVRNIEYIAGLRR
jgi:hypothetical protein